MLMVWIENECRGVNEQTETKLEKNIGECNGEQSEIHKTNEGYLGYV